MDSASSTATAALSASGSDTGSQSLPPALPPIRANEVDAAAPSVEEPHLVAIKTALLKALARLCFVAKKDSYVFLRRDIIPSDDSISHISHFK